MQQKNKKRVKSNNSGCKETEKVQVKEICD
jgi:hypothetical protein